MSPSLGLVVVRDRSAKIDGGERREYECLQCCDETNLEGEQRDSEWERDPAERRNSEDHRQRPRHEQDDQVAGEDVGEQTNGERDQAHHVR